MMHLDPVSVKEQEVAEHVPCMACGYDLFGLARRNDRAICPECGRETDIHWRRWAAPRELRAREAAGACGFSVIALLFLLPGAFLLSEILLLVLVVFWLSLCVHTGMRYRDVKGVFLACMLRSVAVLLSLAAFFAGVVGTGDLIEREWKGGAGLLLLCVAAGGSSALLWRFSRKRIRYKHRDVSY
jgi:hypothetical protein